MLKPITHEEAQRALSNPDPERPQKNTRVITITVTGPDAGPVAAGLTTSLAQVAKDIETRRPNMGVRVAAVRAVEELADKAAKLKA